ncbi:hypothetical protein quinque_001233 [Culex quinquefasciatus]
MLLLLVLAIAALLALLDYVKKLHRFPSIPTARPNHPVIGNALLFRGTDLQEKFERFNRVFRVDRLVKGWLGPMMYVGVAHPDLIQRVLTDPNCLQKPFYYEFFSIRNGLLTAKYDVWKPSRKVLNRTFNTRFLNDSIRAFRKCSQVMVDRMKCCPEGVPVDVLPYTMQCTLEMICATSMGLDVLEKADNRQFVESMEVNVATRIFHPLSYIDVIYQRTDNYSQLERARHFCLDYAKQTIDKRRAALKNQSISTKEDHEFRRKIIIDQVLEMDGDEELNDQSLRDQIMTFVAAGSDTVGHGVAHACLFLAIFPDLQEKLATEIATVLPLEEVEITPETLKNLTFLDKFFKETMRVAPPAPMIARSNMEEIELDGVRFPPDTIFIMNFYELHRRADIWGRHAGRFDPENFSEERSQGRHPFGYLPFSGGSRNCIGLRYAMINAKIMLIYIVRNFRLSTHLRFEDVKFLMGITLHLAFKHSIVLERRN